MIFTYYPNDFWHKSKYNFDPYNVLLAIATNIPMLIFFCILFLLFGHLADAFIQSDLQIRKSNKL